MTQLVFIRNHWAEIESSYFRGADGLFTVIRFLREHLTLFLCFKVSYWEILVKYVNSGLKFS